MAGSSWTNQVQFLVLVGGAPGAGVFVYDPTVGAGNLIASMTDATADPFGDVTVKGVASYVTAGGRLYAVGLNTSGPSGLPGVTVQNTASLPTIPAGFFAESSASGTIAEASVYSGQATAGDTAAQIIVLSQLGSGLTGGVIELNAGQVWLGNSKTLVINDGSSAVLTAGGGAATLTTDAQGIMSVQGTSGLSGALPMVQVDISTNGPGNTAAATDITKAWSIPANDAVAGTTYTIRGLLLATTGATSAQALTLGCDIAGTKTALATLGASFNGAATATTYAIPFELVMVVDAVTTGTPEVYISAPLGDTSANRLSTNSANLQGFTHAASFAKASGGTFAAYAQWGGAGGTGQLAQTISSRLYREGP